MERTIIRVPHGYSGKLAKIFKCSLVTVSSSLTGKSKSALAKKIRHVALTQYRGKEFIAQTKQEELNH